MAQIPPSSLTATRTAPNEYTVTSATGGNITIGPAGTSSAFTPSELVFAAVAGCAGLSAEAQLTHHLGDDFAAHATVEATIAQGLIADLLYTLNVDFGELEQDKLDKLIAATAKKIERLCVVKRSVHHSITTQTIIAPAAGRPGQATDD
ncbi:hypothetical protein CDES_05120 [Corynebacterium deserti GIMN1.010]|uniref:OsmC family protein n=1 Tax=Corynebacterium deserti GIMN1.010 TaxID=931089 RepID=A0A0M4CIQ4_9CORY|nr:OsmC family protein [Corynebacterium deserti]ALC05464.1 hypothetical protein CDES_05120 [Corynebacterium deserti GIMN1.010]